MVEGGHANNARFCDRAPLRLPPIFSGDDFFVTWGAFYLANRGGLRRMKYVFPVKLIGNIYGKVLEELNIETRRPCSACYLRTSSVARNADIFRFFDGRPWFAGGGRIPGAIGHVLN